MICKWGHDHLPDATLFWNHCCEVSKSETLDEIRDLFVFPDQVHEFVVQSLKSMAVVSTSVFSIEYFADGRVSILVLADGATAFYPMRVVLEPIWLTSLEVVYKIQYMVREQLIHPIMDI